jgi:hypothetical protein
MDVQFDTLTDTLNNTISSQVSPTTSWMNMAGGLQKASASSAGYVWGFEGNYVYTCQLPCTGNWTQISFPGKTVLDLVTDEINVYVTDGNTVYIKDAANHTDWITIPIPMSVSSLFETQSFLWVQGGGAKKMRLAKPGTTGNWVQVNDPSNAVITSASATSLYGTDPVGNAVKSDETLQTGWSIIPTVQGAKVQRVFGDIDQTAIYAIDQMGNLMRCSDHCVPVQTNGKTVSNLTIDPVSRNVWMTTTTPGTLGNIYTRPDTTDPTKIQANTQPLDTQRDGLVGTAVNSFENSTQENVVMRQLREMKNFLSNHFHVNTKTKKHNTDKQGVLRDDINRTTATINQLNASKPILVAILITLGVVMLIYVFGGLLGWIAHLLASIALVGCMIYIVVEQNKDGSSGSV